MSAIRKIHGTSVRTREESKLAKSRKEIKFKETLVERYGVASTMGCAEILAKSRETLIARYGVTSIFKLPETIESRKQTFIARFGVDHHMKLDEYKRQANKNRKQNKLYKFSDGSEVKTQGHGDLALTILDLEGYQSSDIITEHYSDVRYQNGDKQSAHIFDIYISAENRVIEVKGTHPRYGYDADKELCHIKMDAAKAMGYSYEIWVFESTGLRIIK